MRITSYFLIVLTNLLFQGCQRYYQEFCVDSPLACVNLIDWEGSQTTIRSDERLKMYNNVDFLSPQPYEKILRVYKRDEQGDSYSYVTAYHQNGILKQYLEVRNAGVFGIYREWHENGQMKLECTVIGGTPELTHDAQKDWQFDGIAQAWDDKGNQTTVYNYCKGSLEGDSFQYYPDGSIKVQSPYLRGQLQGTEKMFFPDGELMAAAEWKNGALDGEAKRYWSAGKIASEELLEDNRVVEGNYYDKSGKLLASIKEGRGHKALFDGEHLSEVQQFEEGIPSGEVRMFNKKGHLIKLYDIRNGVKHGQEMVFYPPKMGTPFNDPSKLQAQLLISWNDGKVHGITKTWYLDGTLESQREMSNNRRNGIGSAWYRDGSLMLMEEYYNDKLQRGEYYRKGNYKPESRVTDGDGTATLFDNDGVPLQKVTYYHGFVLD